MTQKHSLVILAVALLLCCTLCGCQTKREKEVYVPEDEWTGLQTDAYVEYMVENKQMYAKLFPDGGEIRPHGMSNYPVHPLERFEFRMEKETYSLSELEHDDVIYYMFRFIKDPDSDAVEYATIYHDVLLERYNGTEWERLIYVPQFFEYSIEPLISWWGEIRSREEMSVRPIELSRLATRITPGKYRAVACVNDENGLLYAEFEVVE